MNISAYILEYLKQYGTAAVPQFGVFSLENSKAVYNSENGSILPPSTKIAFTSDLSASGEDLVNFISNQKDISTKSAEGELKVQTDFWKKKLQAESSLEVKGLGVFFQKENDLVFEGLRLKADQPDFYGLEEIRFSDIKSTDQQAVPKPVDEDYTFNKSILWLFLIVVPVVAIGYFAYTQQELLFGKKSFDSISLQTKTKRIENVALPKKDSLQQKLADSTHKATQIKDSLKQDSLKKTKAANAITATANPKTKPQWQK